MFQQRRRAFHPIERVLWLLAFAAGMILSWALLLEAVRLLVRTVKG
jgi:hypothetical protein